MKAYLNDWSLSSSKNVIDNMDRIKAFKELLDELKRICGIEVSAPMNLWDIPLSGFNLQTMSTDLPVDCYVSRETLQFLKSIYKDMHPETTGEPLFSEKEDMSNPSSSVGMAASNSLPTLSFAFDDRYTKDEIRGWLQTKEEEILSRSVVNIFKKKEDIFKHLADITCCREMDPLKTPLWNTNLVREYLKDVDFVNADAKSRQGLLIQYGRIVAEMNGWHYNRTISSLNKNSGQLRYIFDSEMHFVSKPVAYLSIDMEGPDLAFELCDRRGKHQGEFSWDGKQKPSKEHHDILVR